MKFLIVPALLISSVVLSQSPTPVVVKSSPASDALVHAAQELATQQKSYDTILNQARSGMEANQKTLQADIQKANADLLAELKADKKYKDKLDAIDALQKKLNTVGEQAGQKFQQDAGPIQNVINTDKAVIDGLIPVVRKENDLPPTATFDSATQTWTDTKPVEPKK